MERHKVAVVLGIRPDFIRTSKVLRLLKAHPRFETTLIHTGQHYDRELSSVFFEQLDVPFPDVQLDCTGKNHNEQHSKLIIQLSDTLERLEPDVCLFLGDANATIGCIAPLKLGIPIVHIEAGMRSYSWDTPEERNRILIDSVSDVLYVYQDDYRVQLVQEGISPDKIEVVGNVIVDVIKEHKEKFKWPIDRIEDGFPLTVHYKPVNIQGTKVMRKKFALMTLHRDEHMRNPARAQSIIYQVGSATKAMNLPVVLIEMPRLKALKLEYSSNFIVTPPLGYFEFGQLEANAAIEYTDSGTNQESASILGTPCVVTRDCTERPECRDCGTTVLGGYIRIADATKKVLEAKRKFGFSLGDGKSSQRIVDNLVERLDQSKDDRCGWKPGVRSGMTPSFKGRHNRIL